jgi:hypothetical protein
MKNLLIVMWLGSLSLFANAAEIPAFPQTFPKAYKSLANLQPQLQGIGNDYCKQATTASSILPKLAKPEYQAMLVQEVNVAEVICKAGTYKGFPQTPLDSNLKFFSDLELLRLVSFKLFVLFKEVPGAETSIHFVMQRLQQFETITSQNIIDAYNPPGSSDVYPPTSDVAEWVRELHDIYGTKQVL